jgi:flagellar hook-basal body complex protein FliE
MAISAIGAGAPVSFDLLKQVAGGAGEPGATDALGIGSGFGSGAVAGSGSRTSIGEHGATAASFASSVGNAVTHLNGLHNTADARANQAVTGQLTNVEDYLTAATEAQLTTQLTVAVRNKAVEAYQEIMRMAV